VKTVLYVSPNGYLGGAERFVLDACRGHLEGSEFLPVIIFFNDGEAVREAVRTGIRCFILKQRFKMSRPIDFLRALIELRQLVKELSPDIIHATMPYAHIAMNLSLIGQQKKTVWFQHGPVGGTLDKIAGTFQTDLLLYNSSYTRSVHRQSALVRAQKEEILNLGVQSRNLKTRDFTLRRFGTSGRICSWKGLHTIIEAMSSLPQMELTVAGAPKTPKDATYFDDLKVRVQELGLSPRIKFLGHVENMSSFYESVDIFVHASIIPEPFGLVVAEAMAHGCLVIGSNQGGVGEVIKNNETGLSFDATATDAKERMVPLLARAATMTADEARILAENGRVSVITRYSPSKMVSELERLYRNLVT
jgi:glycosyltransferase involved in cell wall biosynthesis